MDYWDKLSTEMVVCWFYSYELHTGAAPRGGLEWTCPPHFFEDRFSNSSKFDEKRLGGGRFWPLRDRYSFPFVYNSVISRGRLFRVVYNQPYGISYLK